MTIAIQNPIYLSFLTNDTDTKGGSMVIIYPLCQDRLNKTPFFIKEGCLHYKCFNGKSSHGVRDYEHEELTLHFANSLHQTVTLNAN